MKVVCCKAVQYCGCGKEQWPLGQRLGRRGAVVPGRGRQVPLDLRCLPDLEAHPDVQEHQDAHGEDEEDERRELVHRIALE